MAVSRPVSFLIQISCKTQTMVGMSWALSAEGANRSNFQTLSTGDLRALFFLL